MKNMQSLQNLFSADKRARSLIVAGKCSEKSEISKQLSCKNEILTITLEIYTVFNIRCVCARVCCVAGGLGASDKQTASTRLWHYTFPLIALFADDGGGGRRQRGAFEVKTQSRRPIYATPGIIETRAMR
jgi:hypothetical protein